MAILAECPWCHKKQLIRNRTYTWSIVGVAELESWKNHYGLNKFKKTPAKENILRGT